MRRASETSKVAGLTEGVLGYVHILSGGTGGEAVPFGCVAVSECSLVLMCYRYFNPLPAGAQLQTRRVGGGGGGVTSNSAHKHSREK